MDCRLKRGVHRPKVEQQYIFAISQLYRRLVPTQQERIRQLCMQADKEYSAALLAFVTTDRSAVSVSMEYNISEATLYRAVRKYYEIFPVPFG